VKTEQVTVSERPARKGKAENKNAFIFRKSKMKASTNPAENRSAGWPHPSLCGEVPAPHGASGRAQSNRYPDSGLQISLPPSRRFNDRSRQWLVGACNPIQWRNRRRFSRRSLRLTATTDGPKPVSFKERDGSTPACESCQGKFPKLFSQARFDPTAFVAAEVIQPIFGAISPGPAFRLHA